MVLSNAGTLAGFSTQTGTGSTSTRPRMVAGFDHLELSMIDYTTPYVMGNVDIIGLTTKLNAKSYLISPNPVKDMLNFTAKGHKYDWEICNINGSQILCGRSEIESTHLNIADLKPGLYLFKTVNLQTKLQTSTKFIKE